MNSHGWENTPSTSFWLNSNYKNVSIYNVIYFYILWRSSGKWSKFWTLNINLKPLKFDGLWNVHLIVLPQVLWAFSCLFVCLERNKPFALHDLITGRFKLFLFRQCYGLIICFDLIKSRSVSQYRCKTKICLTEFYC